MNTLPQVARQLGVPENVVEVAARDGRLATCRFTLGGRRYATEQAVEAYVAAYIQPLKDAGEFAGEVSA